MTLDGAPDLSGLSTSGANQSSIFLADATNSNRKIFWITAVDNVLKTVDVDVAPTGIVSSAWSIGGRFHLGPTGTPANASIEGALRAGDTAIFNNSPAPQNAAIWTFRNSGSNSAGFAKVIGKTGVRPVLNSTGTTNVVAGTANLTWLENVELDQDGATGNVHQGFGNGSVCYNVKISDGGGQGIELGAQNGVRVIGCEISGVGGRGIAMSGAGNAVIGCYIHDVTLDGIRVVTSNLSEALINNLIIACGGRGITYDGASTTFAHCVACIGNTIVNCGNSGIEVADADSVTMLINNILVNNGDAGGEANIEWAAGFAEAVGFHGYNTIYSASAVAPINFTPDAQVPGTEFTTDPLFANAAARNFRLAVGSPALNTGFPGAFAGGLTTGSPSQGAVAPSVDGL